MTINETAKAAHENAKSKGFFDEPKNIVEMLCLIHSEVSEALEAHRIGNEKYFDGGNLTEFVKTASDNSFKSQFERSIKNCFADELAAIMIRVMDLAAFKGIDLEAHLAAKMRYNSLRPHKHGKKY